MQNRNSLTPVFVYGSLKSMYWNNDIISSSPSSVFEGEVTTKDHVFLMRSLGAFPGVHKGGSCAIRGELYLVNNETLARLDILEGNGHFYTRELVDVQEFSEKAWIYLLPEINVDNQEIIEYYNTRSQKLSDNSVKTFDKIQEWNKSYTY